MLARVREVASALTLSLVRRCERGWPHPTAVPVRAGASGSWPLAGRSRCAAGALLPEEANGREGVHGSAPRDPVRVARCRHAMVATVGADGMVSRACQHPALDRRSGVRTPCRRPQSVKGYDFVVWGGVVVKHPGHHAEGKTLHIVVQGVRRVAPPVTSIAHDILQAMGCRPEVKKNPRRGYGPRCREARHERANAVDLSKINLMRFGAARAKRGQCGPSPRE